MSGTPVTVAETQEKIHRSKTRIGDGQAGYLEEKIVGSEYINITEEDGSVGKKLVVELDASAVATGVLDHKVKVDASDVAELLESKITAGTGIAITKKTVSGKKNLEIAGAYTEGAGIDITADVIKLDANLDDLKDVVIGAGAEGQLVSYDSGSSKFVNTDYAVETTFSGTASKIPNSDSVADTLRALTITDAADVGASGNSIMYKTKDINIYGMPISVVAWTAADVFTNHLPNAVPDPDILANQGIGPYGFRNKRYVSIKSIESNPQRAGDGYAYAFANFTLDENWDAGDGSGIRARLFIASREAAPDAKQATVRVEYTIFDTDNNNVIGTITKNVLWDSGDSIIKEVDFPLTFTGFTAGKPLNVFLAISIASNLYTPETDYTMYDQVGITGARIIYLTKTINLRDADLDI